MSLNDARVIYPVRDVSASCIVDGHMHINSGACAPLPLLYGKVESKAAGADVSGVPVVQTRESLEATMKAFGFIDGINIRIGRISCRLRQCARYPLPPPLFR